MCISCLRRKDTIILSRKFICLYTQGPTRATSRGHVHPWLTPSYRALYLRGDPYETSDAVFGVKESLLIDLGTVDAEQAKRYGVKEGSKLISYDFVLASKEESDQLREKNAMEAMHQLGRKVKMWNGLPVPDVD